MEIPVFDIKGLPVQLQPDANRLKKIYLESYSNTSTPIVIDNGSFNCRAGWGGMSDPLLIFRSIVARQKNNQDVQEVLVGSEIPESDIYKLSIKSPFEKGILQHFHTQENVMDYIFWMLGIHDNSVNHPLLITEVPCCPNYSRDLLLELAFEAYSVPCVNFGIDAIFALRKNKGPKATGMVISFGNQSTHIMPCIEGEFLASYSKRINIGGMHCTQSLLKFLQTRYFYAKNLILWPLAQEIIYSHCYTSLNYFQELENLKNGKLIRIQLPWVMQQQPSEEEIKKKHQQRKEQGKKLKEIAIKKSEEKRKLATNELEELENFITKFKKNSTEFQDGLAARSIESYDELKRRINILRSKLNLEVEETDKFNLLSIPDEELSPDLVKQKRLQKIQKANRDLREQRKAKAQEEQERIEKLKVEDPEAYLQDLHRQRQEVLQRIEDRKKLKIELQNRNSRTNQRRQKVIAELVTEVGDDNFGLKDQDWNVYREIHIDNQEEEEEDQSLLIELDTKISTIDTNHLINIGEVWRPPTAEDYQILLEVDRIRPPEILFQPSIIGLEQAGLASTLDQVFRLFPSFQADRLAQNIFLTGASVLFPYFKERLEVDVRAMRPFQSEFKIEMAKDVSLDPWRGASDFSMTQEFLDTGITIEDYKEYGSSMFSNKRRHFASNLYYETPEKGDVSIKKTKFR
jgi:actin-related protein 5